MSKIRFNLPSFLRFTIFGLLYTKLRVSLVTGTIFKLHVSTDIHVSWSQEAEKVICDMYVSTLADTQMMVGTWNLSQGTV